MKDNPPKGDVRRPILLELERRLLLSADATTLLADPDLAADPDLPEPPAQVDLVESEEPASQKDIVVRRELVIFDPGVEDYELLVNDLRASSPADRGIEVILLDPDEDGIAQIGEILAGYDNLDAVHIVSHGTDAAVQLGSGWLAADSLDAHASAVAGWADALSLDADLLFYGCDLAGSVEGKALVEFLSDLTGADVAASDDATGAAELGGDWDLEYQRGTVEAGVAFSDAAQASYQNVLDIGIDPVSSTGSIRGTDTTTFSHTTGTGDDRLMLIGVSFGWDQGRTVDSITYNGDSATLVGVRERQQRRRDRRHDVRWCRSVDALRALHFEHRPERVDAFSEHRLCARRTGLWGHGHRREWQQHPHAWCRANGALGSF
ncbi:MAG: DUF4347 domain-containing protein [Deltaproteobacteria bacterium]|nr:DUF4347 domain-containing protein [Deltaproteobacteria bacterium]